MSCTPCAAASQRARALLSQGRGRSESAGLHAAQGMPASSAHATGVPGSADKWAWAYALLLCVVMALGSWCNANNQAIVAMARPGPAPD